MTTDLPASDPSGVPPARTAGDSKFARGERARLARRVEVLDALAERRDRFRRRNACYQRELERLARFHVPPGKSRLAGEDLVEHEAHGVEVGASSRASLGARRSRAARSSPAISSIEMKCSTRA